MPIASSARSVPVEVIGRVVVALLIAGPAVEPRAERWGDDEGLDHVAVRVLVDRIAESLGRAGSVGNHEHAMDDPRFHRRTNDRRCVAVDRVAVALCDPQQEQRADDDPGRADEEPRPEPDARCSEENEENAQDPEHERNRHELPLLEDLHPFPLRSASVRN